MLYIGHGRSGLKPREAILKFCDLIAELSSNPGVKSFATIVGQQSNQMNNSHRKIAKFLKMVRDLLGTTQNGIEVIERLKHPDSPNRHLTGFQLLYPTGDQLGVCLLFDSGRTSTFHFRTNSCKLAKKLAQMANLPEPQCLLEWPRRAVEAKVDTKIPISLLGTPVPLGEVVDLIEKYRL